MFDLQRRSCSVFMGRQRSGKDSPGTERRHPRFHQASTGSTHCISLLYNNIKYVFFSLIPVMIFLIYFREYSVIRMTLLCLKLTLWSGGSSSHSVIFYLSPSASWKSPCWAARGAIRSPMLRTVLLERWILFLHFDRIIHINLYYTALSFKCNYYCIN